MILSDRQVMIHRPYTEMGNSPRAVNVTAAEVSENVRQMRLAIGGYLEEMNIGGRLLDDMLIVPPDRGRTLTRSELVTYGITPTDPVMSRRTRARRECIPKDQLYLDQTPYGGNTNVETTPCYLQIMQQSVRKQ